MLIETAPLGAESSVACRLGPARPVGSLGLRRRAAVGNDYWLNAILIPFLVLSLAGLGLNLLTGYAGQMSLGSAGFMAVGAFATYRLLLRLPGLPLAGEHCSAAD